MRFGLPYWSLLVTLLPISSTTAYSSGAGACLSGEASTANSPHTQGDRTITAQSFADSDFSFAVDGAAISANTTGVGMTLAPGTTYTLSVQPAGASSTATFKGALIRVEQGDGSGMMLMADKASVESTMCVAPAMGVSHSEPSPKTLFSAKFDTTSTSDPVYADVTVVVVNNSTDSLYVYDRFLLNVAADGTSSGATTASPSGPISTMTTMTTAPTSAMTGEQTADTVPTLAPSVATSPSAGSAVPSIVGGGSGSSTNTNSSDVPSTMPKSDVPSDMPSVNMAIATGAPVAVAATGMPLAPPTSGSPVASPVATTAQPTNKTPLDKATSGARRNQNSNFGVLGTTTAVVTLMSLLGALM